VRTEFNWWRFSYNNLPVTFWFLLVGQLRRISRTGGKAVGTRIIGGVSYNDLTICELGGPVGTGVTWWRFSYNNLTSSLFSLIRPNTKDFAVWGTRWVLVLLAA
jgi:hypothetical protein